MEETLKRITFPSRGISPNYDPLAHARMKADTINRTPGNLSGMDCPKCLNRGSIAYPRADGTSDIFFKDCECMTMRKCIWKMEKSGLKNVIRDCTFAKFECSAPWQETALQMAEAYAKTPVGWFLTCGQSGSGKTHLCTAICRELLLAGREVVYMPWRQDVAELKAASLDKEAREKKMAELKKADYLYIDDLFKIGADASGNARPTSADIGLAFEIVNHRYINNLPTIFSTEFYPEKLVEFDEATGGRILEMAKSGMMKIKKSPERNFRLRGIVDL